MSEQQTTSACPHPEAVGTRWGDPISEERQVELQGYLTRWAAETEHGRRKGPFHGVRLTGADVSSLADRARPPHVAIEPTSHMSANFLAAIIDETNVELPDLHLEGAKLDGAHLEGARLRGAHFEGADMSRARLEGATLAGAHMEGGRIDWANLENADLRAANLEGALVFYANLRFAHMDDAHVNGAHLIGAHLEGANLGGASLARADLCNVWMDKATSLNNVMLERASLDQATFDNTNLSVVDWKKIPILGDELTAQTARDAGGKRKSRQQRITDYQAAVRAYRRLAVALQANGLSEEATNYLYRASIMQRRLSRHERRLGAYFFSVLLAVLAGYGYRLGRIVVAYVTVVAAFALAFLAARYFAGTVIDWEQAGEATQISLNAIHGRVFFAQLTLDSVQAWIATVESVVGIVIEGVFVAMLIQRFFGR